MITAVDSSVLLDVFAADPNFGLSSKEALTRARAEGSLVACDVVWAEVSAAFPTVADAVGAFERLHVGFSALNREAAMAAGEMWRKHRRPRTPSTRLVADFLIGAHAQHQADRLLTRDRGFYRRSFQELKVIDPSRS